MVNCTLMAEEIALQYCLPFWFPLLFFLQMAATKHKIILILKIQVLDERKECDVNSS